MQTSLVNPTSFTITTPGTHTVQWCSIDNLDNNECVSQVWSKSIYAGNVSNSACGIIGLVTMVIAAIIILAIVVYGLAGGLDAMGIVPLIVMAIVGVICIIIISEILVPVCSIV